MKLGIICLASKVKNLEEYNKFINYLEVHNIDYEISKTCTNYTNYLGSSDSEKVEEFYRLLENSSITHIYCYKGGYGSARLLDKLDFKRISQTSKTLSGFSDISALLNNMPSSIKCYHGPMAYNVVSQNTFNDLFNNIENKIITHNQDLTFLNCEEIEGEIVGGNLVIINSLLATPFEIDFKDKYVLIEEVSEYPYVIDRLFNQLRLAGKLADAKGFIIGTFTKCNPDEDAVTVEDILNEYIYSLNKPTVLNFKIGHNYDTATLPIRQEVKLTKTQLIYK